jgi:UDP-N-acetylmuramyl pentapeptide phosphotransferase/UDP-N-acetylglucosamine-1-phosphate transferase
MSIFELPHLPPSVYMAAAVSFGVAVLLVLTKRLHGRFSMDGLVGVQKMHTHPTPRIGGLAIVAGVFMAYHMAKPERQAILGALLIAGMPAFLFGLAEDITKKVSVMARLLATMASGVLGWWLTGISLRGIDLPLVDYLLLWTPVSVAFTAFAVGGVANAVNIVDGFNGLASGFVLIAFIGVAAIAGVNGDKNLALACMAIAGAMVGFWVVNWPLGKIFLGDGGSYFGGFALAWACVLLIERNASITAFAPLLVCIHPVTEVLFSIYRRRMHGTHPGQPDRLHLHSLLMRRVVCPGMNQMLPHDPYLAKMLRNPATGLLLALMTLPAVVAAFALRHHTGWACLAVVGFMLGYVAIYARLVRFHWCSPITFLLTKPAHTLRRVRATG